VELARLIRSHLGALLGSTPTLIINTSDTIDMDAADPFMDPGCGRGEGGQHFQAFHREILCVGQRVMRTQRRVPLLVNIRTHNAAVPGLPIMVGSLNGHSLARMNQRCPGDGDVRFREQGGLIAR
jgi:hypothetical protein